MSLVRSGLVAFGALTAALPAFAADYQPAPAPMLSQKPVSMWTVTIGAEGRMLPEYEGGKDFRFSAVPIIRVARAGAEARFRSARDSAGFALIDTGHFRAGPGLKVRLGRKESDSSDLIGLGDVDWAVEVGGFAEYWPTDWLRTRAELRQGFNGHRGVMADLMADVVVPVTPQLTLSGGPRMVLASAKALEPYFGISTGQALASGLPAYSASGGVRSYGAGAQAQYKWSPRWASHVFVEYERLAGNAGNSPLVTQRGTRDQVQVGIGTTYSFDVQGLW